MSQSGTQTEPKAGPEVPTETPALREPTFEELQAMLLGRTAPVFPVVITRKFNDPTDFDNPVKYKYEYPQGFFVKVWDVDERAEIARMVDANDKDIVKKVVKRALCDKNGKMFYPGKEEVAGPATDLILGAYNSAMIANRFMNERWNPVKEIVKNS